MSERDLEIVRSAQERFGDTGEPAWDAFDPEVEVFDHDIPDAGSYQGFEGVGRWLEQWGEAWESFDFEPEEYIDAGDRVVEVIRLSAIGKGSGARVERQDAIVWTMRDGKAVRIDYYNNRQEALEAAGLT